MSFQYNSSCILKRCASNASSSRAQRSEPVSYSYHQKCKTEQRERDDFPRYSYPLADHVRRPVRQKREEHQHGTCFKTYERRPRPKLICRWRSEEPILRFLYPFFPEKCLAIHEFCSAKSYFFLSILNFKRSVSFGFILEKCIQLL